MRRSHMKMSGKPKTKGGMSMSDLAGRADL